MESRSPFFRWNNYQQPQRPRYVPSTMEIPVHRRTVPVAPKVVSIPVRFVGSEKISTFDSAVKIQKVFRGFLVRKSVKKVVAIDREVNEVERRLSNEETVDLIRKDVKERVKFSEMLMDLLFKLDSVKGVDSGIRNLRKAVIKKAIALQEKIDSIAATVERDAETVDRSSEKTPELEDENYTANISNSGSAGVCDDDKTEIESGGVRNELENVDGAFKHSSIENEGEILEESTACSVESNADPEVPQVSEQGKNTPGKDEVTAEVDDEMMHEEPAEECDGMSEAESQTDSSNNPPNSEDGVAENEEDVVKEEEEDGRIKEREGDGQNREILERMMMDNKRMMEMMSQLFEKNEMQSQLLCSLSQRVDRLEKTLVYEMLRKKKKRNGTDCSEKCPKTKKSGK